MNRLQKKCVIGTAGIHLLLIVILFVGPAFFYSKPKADDLQVLDVIPANLIDAAFNSGVANAAHPWQSHGRRVFAEIRHSKITQQNSAICVRVRSHSSFSSWSHFSQFR